MADTATIPVIDLGPYFAGESGALDRAADELRHALTEIGFYFIVNHGVPRPLVRRIYDEAARFHALPMNAKLAVRIDKHNVGYLPMRGDTLRTSVVQKVTKANFNEALFIARDLPVDHPDVQADKRFRSANP
jgi:isopenicillin N synthase-like dioxygenase